MCGCKNHCCILSKFTNQGPETLSSRLVCKKLTLPNVNIGLELFLQVLRHKKFASFGFFQQDVCHSVTQNLRIGCLLGSGELKHSIQLVRLPTSVFVAVIASQRQRLKKILVRAPGVEAPPSRALVTKPAMHTRIKSCHMSSHLLQQLSNSCV